MKKQFLTEDKKFFFVAETPEEHELIYNLRQRDFDLHQRNGLFFGLGLLMGGMAFGFVCGAGMVLAVMF